MGKNFMISLIGQFRENANSIYIDMSFDESSFNKHFEIIHPKDFETNG